MAGPSALLFPRLLHYIYKDLGFHTLDSIRFRAFKEGGTVGKRVLISYLLAGSGHLSVALAIEHYLKEKQPLWDIRLFEPAEDLKDKALDRYFKQAWRRILEMPDIAAQVIFDMDEALPLLSSFVTSQYMRTAVLKSMGYLKGFRPDVIVSTHWGCTHIFNKARKKLGLQVPLYYVFTELAGVYQLLNCGADLYFAMSPQAGQDLQKAGIAPDKMKLINFVVRPGFSQSGLACRYRAKEAIGIQADSFTLLLSVGGEGIGSIGGFISAFLETVSGGTIIIMTGRNQSLFDELSAKFRNGRVLVFGYREDMESVMAAADVLAGKCGASYSMEAILTGTPFIVTHIGAPSERPNMNYIVENGYGWYAPTPSKFTAVLKEILDTPEFYQKSVNSLTRVPRQNGAEEIALHVIAGVQRGGGSGDGV